MTAPTLTAVITGGAAGLGWGIGRRLIDDGYRVIAADLVPGLTETDDALEQPLWRRLDVTDRACVARVFDSIVDEFGSIDVLVNNAGVQRHRALEDLSWEEWEAVINVDLHGVFNCLQAAGRHMLRSGSGSIVNIASVSARGAAGRAPYATAKAAVVGLTATAGAEWAGRGVRVNAVAPGYIDTGVFRQGVEAGTLDVDAVLARIPAGRLARPEEIANAVSFLVSGQASYMNGQTLYVDGGFAIDYGIPLSRTPAP